MEKQVILPPNVILEIINLKYVSEGHKVDHEAFHQDIEVDLRDYIKYETSQN